MRHRARGSRENGHRKSDDQIMTRKVVTSMIRGSLLQPRFLMRLYFCGRIISENKYNL
jgi:hypothetical protein